MEHILGVPQTNFSLDNATPVPVQHDIKQKLAKMQQDRCDVAEVNRADEDAGDFVWALSS